MNNAPKQTPLHALHLEHSARMVTFAGYRLPLHYPTGIKQEHLHTRARAGLFDVSHMGQIAVRGNAAEESLQALIPSDLKALSVGDGCYTALTNEQGGIRDDAIVNRAPDGFRLVVNAACKRDDYAYLRQRLPPETRVEIEEDRALLALQGPAAAAVLAVEIPKARRLASMRMESCLLDGVELLISRCGYTGEDGFEISLPAAAAAPFARRLLAGEQVRLAGLGARDSLRLEAGLCLYGQDLDASTTPVEAGLSWIIGKRFRAESAPTPPPFPGADIILRQLRSGPPRLRVGLRASGRIPARAGAALADADGKRVGRVSSGGFGVTVDAPIAMAYVAPAAAQAGTRLYAEVRQKQIELIVTALPFAPRARRPHSKPNTSTQPTPTAAG